MSWPWSQLGLPGPSDLQEVRHAYAEKLKTTHPEDDPEGFQRLHSAYQLASRMARQRGKQKAQPVPPPEREKRPSPPRQEEQEFDYDQLLREGGERPHLSHQEDGEKQDFDYDQLLREGGEHPYLSHQEDGEKRDFDYDQLLREGGERPHLSHQEDEEKRDFDFDRLFAEGEAERAEARRRRGEERRKRQEEERQARQTQRAVYEQERRERFDQEQLKWQNTETILHTIEMMINSQTDRENWERFFLGPLFQQMKGSIDLIFGLEDIVSTRQDMPRGARVTLFLAYGFDKGVSRPEQRPLFQLLLPAWKAERDEKHRQRMLNIFGGAGGVVGVLVIGMIITSNYLPGFIILGALALYGLTKHWFKREPEDLNGRRRVNWYRVCFAVGVVIAAAVMVFQLPGMWERAELMLPSSDPREQVCRYLEQDYGEEFSSLYNKNAPNERLGNVFSLGNESSRVFLAGPDGERDKKNGKLGYTTNYPEMMVLWRLKQFAADHKIFTVGNVDGSQGLERWETSGTYLISLNFYGDGEVIAELGELLAEMAQEDWYQVRTPEFEIVLCSGLLKDGRLVLDRYKPEDGAFDAQAVQELYQSSFAHAYCAQLIQDEELDRDFIRGGTEQYSLTSEGMTELKGAQCCRLYGRNEDGEVAMEYYMDVEQTNLYCVPGGFWETGREEDIQFYRLLHLDRTGGLLQLYYPWITRY